MKRFLVAAILFLSASAFAAETGFGQLSASCVAVTTTGPCVSFNVHPPDYIHVPQANSFTWQTIFSGGTPTSGTFLLEGSIDGTTWTTLDTSTSTAGETRSITGTAVSFFRCNVSAYSRNGTTLGCQITPSFVTSGIDSSTLPVNSATSGGGFSANCITSSQLNVQTTGTIVLNANEVRYFRCFLPVAFTIGHASVTISGSAAGTAASGIYSCVSPYPFLVKFTFDASSLGTVSNSATPVVIPRGCIIFAQSASSTSMAPHTYNGNSAGEINAVTPNFGTASNSASGGALPATLGTLTGSTSIPPYVMATFFEY